MTRVLALLLLALGACAPRGAESEAEPDRPLVVSTTTMLADAAMQIAGDAAEVRCLLSPGADPHLYQPRPSDSSTIAQADLVITSGLGLEGWVDELIDGAGGGASRLVATEGIEPLRHPDYPEVGDPHFWFDLQRWAQAASNVEAALLEVVAEDAQSGVQERAAAYRDEIIALHTWGVERIASIPEAKRTLITSHDAFYYFSETYGIEVRGLQGITTEQQPSQRDVAQTIELVRASGVAAVFVETSVNPTAIERVASEAGVAVAGPLHSDSIGAPDTPAGTFAGMFVENVRMIVEGLGGEWEAPGA